MDMIRYLSGWRENETQCYLTYHKLTNEEIIKIIDDENFRLHKGIN